MQKSASRSLEVTQPRQRCASLWPGSGWPTTALTSPWASSLVESVAGSSSPESSSLAATCCSSTNRRTTSTADAKAWLVGFLRSYRGALLVVSHDIELLDESITRVMHLDEGVLVEYKGTYTQYRDARAKDEVRRAKIAEHQSAEIKRLSDLADSMRHQTAKRARVAKSLDKRVARLEAVATPAPRRRERRYRVTFPALRIRAVWS